MDKGVILVSYPPAVLY